MNFVIVETSEFSNVCFLNVMILEPSLMIRFCAVCWDMNGLGLPVSGSQLISSLLHIVSNQNSHCSFPLTEVIFVVLKFKELMKLIAFQSSIISLT